MPKHHAYGKRVHWISNSHDSVTIPRAPAFSYRIVDCPDCKAAIGEPCFSLTSGNCVTMGHISRRRVAMRKYFEDRENESAAETVSPDEYGEVS